MSICESATKSFCRGQLEGLALAGRLDDILSAVDPHVAAALIERCLCEPSAMGRKTRVLVTNNLAALRRSDRIVVVEDSSCARSGTLSELSSGPDPSPLLVAMVATQRNGAEDEEDAKGPDDKGLAEPDEQKQPADAPAAKSKPAKDDLIKAEERKQGSVSLRVYDRWIRAGGNIGLFLAIMLLGFCAPEIANAGSQVWLGVWTQAVQGLDPSGSSVQLFYSGVYSAICVGGMLFVLGRTLAWALIIVRAATKIHTDLLDNVLRLPISFL